MKRATIQTKHGEISGYQTQFGVIALVRPSWLTMDAEYQRPYIDSWAQEIADEWDDAKCRPTNARLRDGLLYITNGQHTANAAVKAGVKEILVIINNGTPSRENEAREFVAFQTRVRRVRPYDTYRASLVAKDKDALILRKVTDDLGLTIVPTVGKTPETLSSITAARRIARPVDGTAAALKEAEQLLRDTLEVAMVWGDGTRFRSEVIQGIADALLSRDKAVVLANARRYSSGDSLYRKANEEAGGRGYHTIALVSLYLSKRPGKAKPLNAVHAV